MFQVVIESSVASHFVRHVERPIAMATIRGSVSQHAPVPWFELRSSYTTHQCREYHHTLWRPCRWEPEVAASSLPARSSPVLVRFAAATSPGWCQCHRVQALLAQCRAKMNVSLLGQHRLEYKYIDNFLAHMTRQCADTPYFLYR